jgi:DNA-binding transcriptional MocR family regulator
VIVAPSEIFSIDGRLDDGIRITFSDNKPDVIEPGITRLADAVSALLKRGTATEPSL